MIVDVRIGIMFGDRGINNKILNINNENSFFWLNIGYLIKILLL